MKAGRAVGKGGGQSWDLTFKANEQSDYVAGGVFITIGPDTFLIDVDHRRMAYPDPGSSTYSPFWLLRSVPAPRH